MLFICGVVDQECRRIFAAESMPTLANLADLTSHAQVMDCDWGPEATVEASEFTARVILSNVTTEAEATALAPAYAEEVVRASMVPDRMWILPSDEVEEWLQKHRRVM